MFKNFLKVSIRNLVRNKTYSFINILGLSIGMVCSILITLFIVDELSYDRYHENAENIYRVGLSGSFGGNELKAYVTGSPAGQTFVEQIPEVLKSSRVVKASFASAEMVVNIDERQYLEENVFYVDSTFFDIFDVDFINGNPQGALSSPYKVILSESTARKYFGNTNVVGKSIQLFGDEYLITGIVEDTPSNSHFHYNILISIVSSDIPTYTTWLANDMSYTYLLLEEGVNPRKVNEKIHDVALTHIERELVMSLGADLESFYEAGNYFKYLLQPIIEIHLHSHTDFEIEPNSNILYVYIFSIIALFILVVACINFMNLSTARSAKRAKEVGIRKVVGASRGALFRQFVFESIVLSFISLFIAMIIIESILPVFNNFISKELNVGYATNPLVIPALILLAIFVGLFSGAYSAGYLSSIKILSVIKSSVFSGKSHSWFRNFLVIFQFTVSIVLFICTFVIYSQLHYIKNKDIGFEKENILIIEKAGYLGNSFNSFKQELEKNSVVTAVAYSNTLPGKIFGGFPMSIPGENTEESYVPRLLRVGYDFDETYQLEMKEGRFFSRDFSTDSLAVIINESAVKEFGLEEPIVGQKIVTNYNNNVTEWNIIGVVKNFNFRSLHQDVGSLVLINDDGHADFISVRFNAGINHEAIQLVENTWNKFVQDAPFEYSIMENDFINLHKEEFKTGEVFMVFSLLAIFIACLGLFGLASFMAEQKTKEIGIRKALGASVLTIVRLLFKQFTLWVIIANVVAWPLAYFFMKSWLQNYAYHTDIKLWIFPAAGFLALFIALITVSYQAITAASKNPTESLRYE
ncbi:MAG TPA: ABC transporter permease [Bacteroidales bacterium]|nr:ABC transporter permease [Bacteroidales bacterium]